MADRMLQFTTMPQHQPDKRDAAVRVADFGEIYRDFAIPSAEAQSSRCSQCGIPFCSIHCPLNNNIPDWLKLTAEGRLDEAYEVSAATNNFPRSAAASARRTASARATASSSAASRV